RRTTPRPPPRPSTPSPPTPGGPPSRPCGSGSCCPTSWAPTATTATHSSCVSACGGAATTRRSCASRSTTRCPHRATSTPWAAARTPRRSSPPGTCPARRACRVRWRSEERRVGKECREGGGQDQAEDGIRDRNVTGVQTCALPICNALVLRQRLRWRGHDAEIVRITLDDEVPASCDVYTVGGGEDSAQKLASRHLSRSPGLQSAV